MRRPILEIILLASLAGCALFWAWALVFGSITFRYGTLLPLAVLLMAATLGVSGFWYLSKRRSVGAALCAIFYSIQAVKVITQSGDTVGVYMTPTIYYRLNTEVAPSVSLNVVAITLLILSLV